MRHTASIGLGGRNVTNDLAIGIRTPLERAEEIKRMHGTCIRSHEGGEYIPVPGVGGREQREVSRAVLASIIERRACVKKFSLWLCARIYQKNHYTRHLGRGHRGSRAAARCCTAPRNWRSKVFGMPVKVGVPKGFGGLRWTAVATPAHATGVGLVQYGLARRKGGKGDDFNGGGDRMMGMLKKMTDWVKQYV